MRHPEQQLQIAAHDLMRLAYPQVVVMAIPNGGYVMAPKTVALLKAMGLRPGAPDWLLVWPGGWGLVEFKADKGPLSPAQMALHPVLSACGAPLAICRSLDSLVLVLRLWGVPRAKARVAA